MRLEDSFRQSPAMLMEGALGERLKREYGLVFDEHVAMAALLYQPEGAAALRSLWHEYMDIARSYRLPLMVTTPTRRANRESVPASGCSARIIEDNVRFLRDVVQEGGGKNVYVGGLMGCRGDAYTGEGALSEEEAFDFHRWAALRFLSGGADFLYAGIMPVLSEAVGMARAMESTELPYIISFTIQRNGRLIDGTSIADAIRFIDEATHNHPLCYMTNCVHPSIVLQALSQPFNCNDTVRQRFRGIQANTSPLSYAELDGAADLKTSAPEAFAEAMMQLDNAACINIWGGCCGTDGRHMTCVARRLWEKKIRSQ